jgi:hypothetical protein
MCGKFSVFDNSGNSETITSSAKHVERHSAAKLNEVIAPRYPVHEDMLPGLIVILVVIISNAKFLEYPKVISAHNASPPYMRIFLYWSFYWRHARCTYQLFFG